ncbi:glycosyltransferase [Providencia rustigianii]|uniref:glycosyltransferase family A protein n=1 Tax=Providencia rustigianii TaxID=158850 RepID=UPI0038B3E749
MTLDMIFSTFGDRIYSLLEKLPKQKNITRLIIIHQTNNKNYSNINKIIEKRSDIFYYPINSKGVTKSRNYGIGKATSDIILFCDDDVTYTTNFQNEILNQYIANPDMDFITFAYSHDPNMHSFASKFLPVSFKHSLKSILKIGTIEVSLRRSAIINKNIKFPEDMGAGTKYFLCDEPVFLSQLLKNKCNGMYCPIIIGYHPEESSGSTFNNHYAFASRYLCFTRIFGSFLGLGLYYLYLAKNFNKFKALSDVNNALFIMFKMKHDK